MPDEPDPMQPRSSCRLWQGKNSLMSATSLERVVRLSMQRLYDVLNR